MHPIHLVLALLITAVWGFNFIVINVGLLQFPPIFLCFARFFLTSIPAVFFIPFPKGNCKWIILYGIVMFALQFSLLFAGMTAKISPGLASILLQSQVFFSILLGVLFLREKLNYPIILGAILAFAGIGFIGIKMKQEITLEGFYFVILAALSWAFGNVISKKMKNIDIKALVSWASLFAWPFLLILSFVLERQSDFFKSFNFSLLSLGCVLYIAYLATLFAFVAWNKILHYYPIAVVAPFTLLVPVFAIISSVFLSKETLELRKIIAGLFIIGGLFITFIGNWILKKNKN